MNAKLFTVQVKDTGWYKLAVVGIFVGVMALLARVTIHLPFTPVPITLQTLGVILSGLVLGARGGAWVQLTYLGLIAMGLPFDAHGLGPASFLGPTAGYLVGFVPAAAVTGWLAGRAAEPGWGSSLLAAGGGILTLYLVGAGWLALVLGSWRAAWLGGVAPFILLDLAKAACAVGLAGSVRRLWGG